MDFKERTIVVNNIIRANNVLIDKKIELDNIRRQKESILHYLDFEKKYLVKNVNKTIKSILINALNEQKELLLIDIKKLNKYIKLRTTLLIGVRKVNDKILYRYFAETFEKNGIIYAQKNTISKGSPITHFSSNDLNGGFINLTEIIIDYTTGEIKKTIDYLYEIRTGSLLPDYKYNDEAFRKYYHIL